MREMRNSRGKPKLVQGHKKKSLTQQLTKCREFQLTRNYIIFLISLLRAFDFRGHAISIVSCFQQKYKKGI